jgi:antitoxin (DNA-binding transcriptional repressor) of toxin-antitoxin stability system
MQLDLHKSVFTEIQMETTLSSTEAVRHFGDMLARLKPTGESFILTKGGKPVARLVPPRAARPATGAEILAALARLPHDPAFADDLDQVSQRDRLPENPRA